MRKIIKTNVKTVTFLFVLLVAAGAQAKAEQHCFGELFSDNYGIFYNYHAKCNKTDTRFEKQIFVGGFTEPSEKRKAAMKRAVVSKLEQLGVHQIATLNYLDKSDRDLFAIDIFSDEDLPEGAQLCRKDLRCTKGVGPRTKTLHAHRK